MGEEVLKKFGRYFLLDRLAQGGMAEIFRSRLAGAEGAGRILVVKRIQASYGSDQEFIQMFKSETKLTMGFNHPNIVQLFDYGEVDKQPYIAMEYIDGKTLRQFMGRLAERAQYFAPERTASIIMQCAAGLHYAHTYKDKISGQTLNIVHRDISPQNLLISYDGNVKIIDFGIAKATNITGVEHTRAGVIKGKLSYLSPEQVRGEPLDGRSDVFAIGIVMWEMLTMKRLFSAKGENEYQILRMIENCNQHVKLPSSLNSKVPKELDYIVLKALSQDRLKRYQTAEELQRALHTFLIKFAPEFNPTDLKYDARQYFEAEIVDDRKRLQDLNGKAEVIIASQELLDNQAQPSGHESRPPTEIPGGYSMPQVNQEFKEIEPGGVEEARIEISKTHHTGRPSKTSGGSAFSKAAPTANKTGVRAAKPPSSRTGANAAQDPLTFRFNKKRRPTDRYPAPEPTPRSLGPALNFLVTAAALVTFLLEPLAGIQVPYVTVFSHQYLPFLHPPSSVAKAPAPESGLVQNVRLALLLPRGGSDPTITVNGRLVDPQLAQVDVPVGETIEISVSKQGYHPFKRQLVIQRDEGRAVANTREEIIDLQPVRYGYLNINSEPSGDAYAYMIDPATKSPIMGFKPWEFRSPASQIKLLPGTYFLRIQNPQLKVEQSTYIQIREGKPIDVNEKLSPVRRR